MIEACGETARYLKPYQLVRGRPAGGAVRGAAAAAAVVV